MVRRIERPASTTAPAGLLLFTWKPLANPNGVTYGAAALRAPEEREEGKECVMFDPRISSSAVETTDSSGVGWEPVMLWGLPHGLSFSRLLPGSARKTEGLSWVREVSGSVLSTSIDAG
ncbi:hypothetical protein BJY04DRAFT_197786 [Aspergillus karnatakaensis]|uniref:uncharacterized protein n=1 Tax=Aspergillus karnatakaensis TaxID=1810916 RepID=UPI003CCD0497